MISQNAASADTHSTADQRSCGGDQRALIERWSAGLGRVAELGEQIVEAIAAKLAPLGARAQFSGLATVYERICWALRLIAALQLKLVRDAKAIGRAERARDADRPETGPHERLERESGERFDFDGFGRLLKRPVEDVVAIVRDILGFTPELRRLVDAAWAGEEAFDEALAAEERRWPQSDPPVPVGSPAHRRVAPAGPS